MAVPFRGAEMFTVSRPVGDWSYMNSLGTTTSRIDHVMHTEAAGVVDAAYCYEVNGVHLAGPRSASPITDHAALVFTVVSTGEFTAVTHSAGQPN